MNREVILLLALTLGTPLPGVVSAVPRSHESPGRVLKAGSWRVLTTISGEDPSILADPLLLAANDQAAYVYDYADHEVKAFALTGRQLWRFGREGQGPSEFVNPTDLQIDGSGRIWLLDPGNGRLTVLSAQGAKLREVRLTVSIRRLVPLDDGGFWGFGSAASFAVRMDAMGRPQFQMTAPPALKDQRDMALEMRASTARGKWAGVLAFMYADAWLLLPTDGQGLLKRGIVRAEFPKVLSWKVGDQVATRLSPDARSAAYSICADSQHVFILSGLADNEDDRGRIVDVYDTMDGSYRYSLMLPERASRLVSLGDGRFVALITDPAPGIRVWSWEASPASN